MPTVSRLSRRGFLAGGALGGVALASGACGVGGTPAPESRQSGAAPIVPAIDPSFRTKFGVNCYDLFYLPFLNGLAKKHPLPRLQAMKRFDLPFVRFSASAYWPNDWKSWEMDKDRYLGVLDAVFEAAEQVAMPLVPCVLWAPFGLSDHLGERYSAWADPKSRTRAFMEDYVPQIIDRYQNSPSLLMWEFSNEMNSFVDKPTSEIWFPPVNVEHGTFSSRNAGDRLSGPGLASAAEAFLALVRRAGGKKPVSTGYNIPRFNQVQNARGFNNPDSLDELTSALEATLSGGYDVLSVHIYPHDLKNRFRSDSATLRTLLEAARRVADTRSAKLFVGEFGVPRSWIRMADATALSAMIADIRTARVDYAAIWAFDYWDADDPFNITPTNNRRWILDMIRDANRGR